MIGIIDAFTLATTKLRTRKIRTIVTAVTAGLLFGVLMAAILITQGVLESAARFTKSGLSERYIANYQDMSGGINYEDTPELQARAIELHDKRINDMKAAAKRLNIEFDPTSEPRPVEKDENGEKYFNTSSFAARQAIQELNSDIPDISQKARGDAQNYNPIKTYPFKTNHNPGTIIAMPDGKEQLETNNESNRQMDMSGKPDVEQGWYYLDENVVEPFLLDKSLLDTQKNTSDIPIIAPIGKVEKALNLPKLPKNATPQEKLDRIAYVRSHAATATFTVCYRNESSSGLITKTIADAKDIQKNIGVKDYVAPALQYELPDASSCGAPTVKKDSRTVAQKRIDSAQIEFSKLFNEYQEPAQQKITFRVVGIAQDGPDYTSFSSTDMLIGLIAGSSLQGKWVVPTNMFNQMPNVQDFQKFSPLTNKQNTDPAKIYLQPQGELIEFNSADDIKAFYTNESCSGFDCDSKPYITYFGSNSALIDDLKSQATQVFQIAGGIIGLIASLIMMGMVSRVIADGRRETAVFRAIGATRNDMRVVYLLYTVLLSLIIATTALGIGLGIALWLDITYADTLTTQMHLTFITAPLEEQLHLIGFWPELLSAAIGLILFSGLVSMLLPLSRNLTRNPIKDMRDE